MASKQALRLAFCHGAAYDSAIAEGFSMRSRLFFVGLLISTIGACSAGGADSTVFDGAAGPPDTNGPDAASGGETDARLTPKFAAPSLVLVNGLVTGGTKAFKDVRVCLDSSGFALPDDRRCR